MCGEKSTAIMPAIPSLGSPPRVRGEGVARDEQRLEIGITPACAGRRLRLPDLSGFIQDHPRVCGEKMGLVL